MKNHIIFKFLAIILCAAALMGAIGGAAGTVILTSGNLYNRTVEEMLQESIHADSYSFTDWLAKNYASSEWGGCSDNLINRLYESHYFDVAYDSDYYGYTLYDWEGNELLSYNPELKEQSLPYQESFSITGKYAYLVSTESKEQLRSREAEAHGEALTLADGVTLPQTGALVTQAIFADGSGNPLVEVFEVFHQGSGSVELVRNTEDTSYEADYDGIPGILLYDAEGYLTFRGLFGGEDLSDDFWFPEMDVAQAVFTLYDGTKLKLDVSPVGSLYWDNDNYLIFRSAEPVVMAEEEPEETEATAATEITEETVPETTAETIPETVAETGEAEEWTEAWEENSEEEWTEEWEDSSASALPEDDSTEPTVAAEWDEAEETPEETKVMETLPMTPTTPVVIAETEPAETEPEETEPEATEPVLINGKPLSEYQINTQEYYDSEQGGTMLAKYVYLTLPEMTVEVYMTRDAIYDYNAYQALELLREYRDYLMPVTAVCLLLVAVFAVYLCTAAGRKPKCDTVEAGGLNRLPLDLYLLAGGFAVACVAVMLEEMWVDILERDFLVGCEVLAGCGFLCCLIFVGFCFAFVAQMKTPGGFLWRNTLCGQCIWLAGRMLNCLKNVTVQKGGPFCGKVLTAFWQMTMKAFVWLYKAMEKLLHRCGGWVGNAFCWMGRTVNRWLKLLPIMWQWLVVGGGMLLVLGIGVASNGLLAICGLLVAVGILLYSAYCFGLLAESAKRMSKGDLDIKVDKKMMVGCFEETAEDLNALADVAVVAAQKQLKSERMKTELITNVSHDIKTPLTSIINYVDLLQKPHSEEEGWQYLEVLDRQSQRLKKLIEDLMEMSKANTGNMTVDITTVDAVESVNQALGEFADKLDRARLIPVFRHSEDRVPMQADGRLVWRVLSNLLGNAVKYALPGTRLYIDLMSMEGKVVLSLKNISREELNVEADELMERFVRGDDSRNTEGSGLGLNIAKSLMELQKGQLQLLVDGDLFKVTLIFPGE